MDWDCAEALVIPDIARTLDHIQQNGTLPVSLASTKSRHTLILFKGVD